MEFACAGNGIPCRRQKRDRCIEFGGVASDYKDANVLVEELRRGGEDAAAAAAGENKCAIEEGMVNGTAGM